jgi:peptidoglycan/LPS O-acetylase OafA/YrhL
MKRLIKKSQFDNIDSLRFLAVFAIIISHSFITSNQQIRVSTLFSDLRQVTANLSTAAYSLLFILTGFLNTWTTFEERFIYKKMNVLRFYMRRLIGVLPVYLLLFLIGYYIMPGIKTSVPVDKVQEISWLRYLSFSFNQGYVENLNPVHAVLGNMWSIAISIQFVIIWPLLMNLFRRNETTLFIICFILFGVSAYFWSGNPSYRFSTFNCLLDFVAGSYLAYFCFFRYKPYNWLKTVTHRSIAFMYALFFSLILFKARFYRLFPDYQFELIYLAERLIISALLTFFVFEQHFNSHSLLKLAKLKIFTAPGKFAFGLYAYHALGIIMGYAILNFLDLQESMVIVLLFKPILALVVTSVLAVVSYEFFEKKFTRLKVNYSPTREFNPLKTEDVKAKSA